MKASGITLALVVSCLLVVTSVRTPACAEIVVEREVALMGTTARLATYAGSRAEGLARLELALEVLERAEAELSTWREDSAVSALNRHPVGEPWQAGSELCRTLGEIYRLSRETGGAFDPAIGPLIHAWDIHGSGRVPTNAALQRARRVSGLQLFAFDKARCQVIRRADVTLDVGGFGKGDALDRVAAVLPPSSWMIDLGGQILVHGTPPKEDAWEVRLAHPRHRDRAYAAVRVASGSLATSAGSERDLVVGGRRVGHILDPVSGRPVEAFGSVTVWHPSALVADVLSTALYVMGPVRGVRFANESGVAALYLISDRHDRVTVQASRTFPALRQTSDADSRSR